MVFSGYMHMLALMLTSQPIASMSVHVGAPAYSRGLMKATWLPINLFPNRAPNSSSVAVVMGQLHAAGVRRVYVDVWNNGVAYFSSPSLAAFSGAASIGPDFLQMVLEAAVPTGIDVVAWFEYGFMAAYGSITSSSSAFARTAQAQGLLLGEFNSFTWLDPSKPQVVAILADMLRDCVEKYSQHSPLGAGLGLAGVQLDDHFCIPPEYSSGDSSTMDAAARAVAAAVRSANASQIFSLSPAPLSSALEAHVDWGQWAAEGLFDEFLPQLYRSQFANFSSLLNTTISSLSSKALGSMVAVGVRANGAGTPTSWEELHRMLQLAGQRGLGVAVWYSDAITNLYAQQFKKIWG